MIANRLLIPRWLGDVITDDWLETINQKSRKAFPVVLQERFKQGANFEFVVERGIVAGENPVTQFSEVIMNANEILKDVVDCPGQLQSNLSFVGQAIEFASDLLVVFAQYSNDFFF